MHDNAAATKRAGSGSRFLMTFVLFVSFFVQSFIAQTHIHQPPAGAVAVGHATAANTSGDRHHNPGDEDPLHCPFCQAVAASGSFLTPVLILLPIPTYSFVVEKLASHRPSAVSPPPHDWHGRGPPQN